MLEPEIETRMQECLVVPAGGIEALDQREQFGPVEGRQPGFDV